MPCRGERSPCPPRCCSVGTVCRRRGAAATCSLALGIYTKAVTLLDACDCSTICSCSSEFSCLLSQSRLRTVWHSQQLAARHLRFVILCSIDTLRSALLRYFIHLASKSSVSTLLRCSIVHTACSCTGASISMSSVVTCSVLTSRQHERMYIVLHRRIDRPRARRGGAWARGRRRGAGARRGPSVPLLALRASRVPSGRGRPASALSAMPCGRRPTSRSPLGATWDGGQADARPGPAGPGVQSGVRCKTTRGRPVTTRRRARPFSFSFCVALPLVV